MYYHLRRPQYDVKGLLHDAVTLWQGQHKPQPLHNFRPFPVIAYTRLKRNIKTITTKNACDWHLYSSLEAPFTKSMTLFAMTLKVIAGFIYFFIY